jgi:ribosomal protein L37AE/L43A
MIETTYECTKCGAQDHDRSPIGIVPPAFLNCWKCKAGLQKDPTYMMANRVGMFPVAGSQRPN